MVDALIPTFTNSYLFLPLPFYLDKDDKKNKDLPTRSAGRTLYCPRQPGDQRELRQHPTDSSGDAARPH